MGDIIAIFQLAVRGYSAYKDAPDDYRHISEEVAAFDILIVKAAQHFKSTTISSSDRYDGQNVLKGCQSVLEDLNSLIGKYRSITSNRRLVFMRAKLGLEDIPTLRARLISNTFLLIGFTIFNTGPPSTDLPPPGSDLEAGLLIPGQATKRLISTNMHGMGNQPTGSSKETIPPQAAPDTITVQPLVGNGTLVECGDAKTSTPLHLAARNGHADIVELLLGEGCPIEAIGEANSTPLHLAANNGHTNVVELLLRKGASIEAINKFNNTPLHLTALCGHTVTAQLLLRKGASIEAINKFNNTPIHLAALCGHTVTAQLLLRNGASIKAFNQDNNTPIHLAAQGGHIGAVELLLKKGASIEATNKYNNTPMHLAAEGGHTDTVKLLITKGGKSALYENSA